MRKIKLLLCVVYLFGCDLTQPNMFQVTKITSVSEFDNIRWKDLSDIEDQLNKDLVRNLNYNGSTVWPDSYNEIASKNLENHKSPGQQILNIHNSGITGAGINVAIIDQNLIGDHPEYKGKIIEYIDMGCDTEGRGSMHGPAVLSLLVGENIGVAPGSKVYYYAAPSWKGDCKYYSDALYNIIERNKSLSASNKIKVVSVSAAPGGSGTPFTKNTELWQLAVEEAKKNNILVIDCTSENNFVGPGFFELEKDKTKENLVSGWPNNRFTTQSGKVTVPSSYRTVAEEYRKERFSHYYCAIGGLSWGIPYAAGVCALAWEVNPDISAKEMKDLLISTAYKTKAGDTVIDPEALINRVKQ